MADKTIAELQAEIAKLQAANAKLAENRHVAALTLKVSTKGAMSVYGLGRFPVTLYGSQWERLIGEMPKVQAFLKANASKLTTK